MTPEKFNESIDKFKGWLQNQFTQDALVVGALNMAKDIRDRVEQTGKNSQGNSFKGYSTKTLLVNSKSFTTKGAWDKVFNEAKNKESGLKWITYKGMKLIVYPGGYKRIRETEGRQTAFKSFNRTAMMWRGFGIKGKKFNLVELGGRDKDSQNKINWNSERERTNIIAPTEQEQKKLANYVSNVIEKKLKEFLS